MSIFEEELDATGALLKNEKITKELARAYSRSVNWVRGHAAELETAGWTVEKLYRIGTLAFPYSSWGPGWLTLWNNEKCEPRLNSRGNLEFVLREAGGDVIQTCWVEKSFLA